VDDTVTSLDVEFDKVGGSFLRFVKRSPLDCRDRNSVFISLTQSPAVLSVCHSDEVVPGNARKIVLKEDFVLDEMEPQEVIQYDHVVRKGLDVIGRKPQKGVIIGGEESPGFSGH